MVVARASGTEAATATRTVSKPKRSVKVSALSQLVKVNHAAVHLVRCRRVVCPFCR